MADFKQRCKVIQHCKTFACIVRLCRRVVIAYYIQNSRCTSLIICGQRSLNDIFDGR